MTLIRPKQLDAALAGGGLARAAGTGILSISALGGLEISGDDVIIDLDSTLVFSGADWTFGADELKVGTPTVGTAAANKDYVDGLISGIAWKDPVKVLGFIGEATVVAINALTPAAGDSVVATTAGTPTAGTSDALVIGDLAEFDGTSWQKLYAASGSRLPAGIRLVVSTTATLLSPLTGSADEGKILESMADPGTDIDGTVSDFLDTGDAVDGNAVLVACPPGNFDVSVNENKGYVFDGAVPTGSYIQFTGTGATVAFSTVTPDSGGSIVADTASDTLTLTGGDGIATVGTPGTDTITFAAALEAAAAGEGGLAIDGGEIRVLANTAAGIELTASGVAVDLEAAGAGEGGLAFDSGEIRVDVGLGLELLAGGVTVDLEADGSGTGGLAFDGNELRVSAGDGIELTAGGVAADLAAAGAGTGGLAIVSAEIAVDAGDGIELTASGVAVDAANDSIDVAAAGIKAPVLNTSNKKEASAVAAAATNDTTGITIDAVPAGDGMVHVFVNGVEYDLAAVKTSDFYFSSDGGTTPKALSAIASGDTLYLGTGMPFDLDAGDDITLVFAQII